MEQRVAILGGGATGVVLARQLARAGTVVDLFEQAPQLGGLQRSVVVDGEVFDIGAFLFSSRHELITAFPSLEPLLLPVQARQLSLTPGGAWDGYPVTLRGYLGAHGWRHSLRALFDLLGSRIHFRRRDTVPAFVQYYVGSTLYRDTGLKSYIERLYGIPDEEVGLEFALQRLRRVQQFFSRRLLRWTPRGPDLVRPREGFNPFYEHIGEHLRGLGVGVHLGRSIGSVSKDAGGFELRWEGGAGRYDRVISTVPVPVMLGLIGQSASSGLEHMHLLSLFYRGAVIPPGAILYNFTHDGRWKRITVFSRYYGASRGADYFTVEITTTDVSEAGIAELIADFERHSSRHPLFHAAPTYLGHAVTPRAYPVFRRGFSEKLQYDRNRLMDFGIHIVGRAGNHEYLTSHTAAAKAKELARKLSAR